ncbi:hypothetical protein HYW67_03525 [Candidatus Parcubacteria bacterium]|nr:hypothetical protein [Candidatus Parcubacteria bacterium]
MDAREHLESLLPEKWRGRAHLLPLPESRTGEGIVLIVFGILGGACTVKAATPLLGLLVAIVFVGQGIAILETNRRAQEKFVGNFSKMTAEERDAYMAKCEAESSSSGPGWPTTEYETEERIHYRKTKWGFERGYYGPYRESGRTVVRREKKK